MESQFKPWEIWDFADIAFQLDRTEQYWERGPGSKSDTSTGPLHTNLAVWGFDVIDSVSLSEGLCTRYLTTTKSKDDTFELPDSPMYRTTQRTLNPHRKMELRELTQIEAAKKLSKDNGGINNLIFWLGANNALGTILRLDEPIVWSIDRDLYVSAHERTTSLWTPAHFEKAYRKALSQLKDVGAKNVWFGNVPHLSIPPISRGVSLNTPEQDDDGYFEFYIPCWVRDESFKKNPKGFPSFTRDTMRMLNGVIDEFNEIINRLVGEYKTAGQPWNVVDMCSVLDSLAFRKNKGKPSYVFPQDCKDAMKRNPKLKDRFDANGRPIVDTRFLCVRPRMNGTDNVYEGGFFSLDGVHPTTLGYGLIA